MLPGEPKGQDGKTGPNLGYALVKRWPILGFRPRLNGSDTRAKGICSKQELFECYGSLPQSVQKCLWVQGLAVTAGFSCNDSSTGLRLAAYGFRPFRKIHVRSPELFDELVLADGRKEAWAPRANKITGQWFDQIKNLKDVSANLMFLKSEDGPRACSAI